MQGFVPQPNLPILLLFSVNQRAAETQCEQCCSLVYRFTENIIFQTTNAAKRTKHARSIENGN